MSDIITVNDLNLWYGPTQALHHVTISVPEHSITALIGPSGCGKSTFLKTLDRMNDLIPGVKVEGQVLYKGQDIYAPGVDVSQLRREVGMVYNYLPFMILPIYTAMTKIDDSIIEAAQDLGCNVWHILFRVLVPLTGPGIATGITQVFVPAVSTFIISRMLGGGSNLLIGDLIELQFLGNSYNLNLGSAMSLVLMVIVLLCMSFTSSFDESEMEGVM